MKAVVPPHEADRLENLRRYNILDTAPEQAFDDLTHLASQICRTPISAITLIDHDRQWFKSGVGLGTTEMPRELSFCSHAILCSEPLIVPDTLADYRFAENPFVTAKPRIRFYAGVRLVTPQGHAIGTLCVLDTKPRQLDQAQLDTLQRLGRQAMELLEARRDAEQLKFSEERYRRLFEAAKDGILILDANTGEIEDVNPFLCQLLNYKPGEILGKQLWEIGAFHDIAANKEVFLLLQEREYIRYSDLPLKTKGGQKISVEFVSNVYVSAGKKVIQCNIRDLTAEKQIIADQERFFTLSLDMLWIIDLNGYFRRLNPAVKNVLGFEPEELIGQLSLDYLHPDDRTTSEQAMGKLADGVPVIDYVNRFRCRDGSYKSILWVTAPSGDHFYAAGRDITERVRAEETLQESKRLLQSTLDALASHIAVLDENSEVIAVNNAWRTFAEENEGTPVSCGIGANYFEVCIRAMGDGVEEAALVAQGIREVTVARQISFSLEYPCHSPMEERWFNISVTRFMGEGPVRVVVAHENISERKRAENLIRTSEMNLAVAQQIAHLGSWELDLSNTDEINRNPLRWSDEVFRIFGYRPGEIEVSNENFFRAVHHDDREQITEAMANAYREGKAYSLDHRILLPDGSERIVHEQSETVYDECTGKAIKMVGTVQDITERKRTEVQLNFQKTLLEAQTEASLDGILVVSGEGKILSYNQRFLQMWEVPPQLTIDGNDDKLLQAIVVKVSNPQQFLERVTYLYEHRDERSHEEVTLHTGRIFDRYSAPIAGAEGSYYGRVWYFRDITERRQSEVALRISTERFEILSRATNDAIWDWNLLTNNLWWNDRFENLFGYQRKDIEPGIESWKSRLHPDDRERVADGINAMIESGKQSWSDEYRFRRADGSYAEIFDRGFIILDDKHSPIRMVGSMQDRSERKQAERALSESEERLQNILANVPGMVYQFVLHVDGSVEWPFVGRGCQEIFEVQPETLQNNPSWPKEKIYPDDQIEYENTLLVSAETMLPRDWVGRLLLPSGKTKWLQLTSRPQRLPDGSTLWNGLIMDISDRKREEEENARLQAEVEQQRQRTDNIVASVPGIVWETWNTPTEAPQLAVEASPHIDFVSDYVTTMLGYSVEEWLATPHFWMSILYPDDIEQVIREGQAIFSNGQGGTSQYRWIAKAGHLVWVEARMVVIFDEVGQRLGLRGVTIDITERKQAEAALQQANDELERRVEERTTQIQQANEALRVEGIERMMVMDALRSSSEALSESQQRLQVVMNHIPQAIFWKDLNFAYVGCNYRLAKDAGFDSPEDLTGKTDFDMPWAEYTADYQADDRQVMETDTPKLNIEEHLLKADGSTVWLRTNKIPLHDTENKVVGVLCSYEDITDQKQAEASLIEARQEADAANLAKSEFLSRMSHELRTPLNAILGFGQILNRQQLTPVQHESIGYIVKGGHHLLSLINEVLDIARIEAGHIELSIEPVALSEVVAESCALVRPLADQRTIRLINGLVMKNSLYVMADQQRLKQVIINLLSNAIKYNREGGKVVISTIEVTDRRIQIRILDSGFGVSPEDLQKLFIPFERLNAADLQIEGTGLGLVLSKRLVTAMNGTLGVESILGQGSTFWIELPSTIAPIDALAEVLAKQHQEAVREIEGTYTVLSIEDNLSNIHLLEAILEDRTEITLITAMQGSIGLDLARQHHPDVILLDLNLPGLSGSEVLSQLRQSENTRGIPVIVISADATSERIESLINAGARAYLTKPINVEEFLNLLDEVLLTSEKNARFSDQEAAE